MKITVAASLASVLLGTACSGGRSSEITRNRDTNRVERDAQVEPDARSDDDDPSDADQTEPEVVADAGETDPPDASASEDAALDAATLDAAAGDRDAALTLDVASEGDALTLDAGSADAADGAPDAAEPAIDAGNGEAPDGNVCGTELSSAPGCADGLRRGLTSGVRHPDIAACAGSWVGDVSNANALCADGFHVCTGAEPVLRAITYQLASCFTGCFAFDAAQDNYQCLPDCSSRIGSIDTAQRLDMAGMGSGCPYKFSNANSCLMSGRIDASENDGIGCNYNERFSGVVCCRD